eukprot:g681.t1
MCIALSVECFLLAEFMIRENTAWRRDTQIKLDVLENFFCVALPLLIMWYGYKVPISVEEMLQLTFLPSLSLLKKLDTILEGIIRFRTATTLLKAEEKAAVRASRRRNSFFNDITLFEVAKQQQEAVPYIVHVGAGICQAIFGIVFLCTAIVQLVAQHNTTCEPLLWDSCVVRAPFCGNAFRPTCNCAVLNVRKHNWTALPDEIYEMKALKVMRINHGPLEVLPDNTDRSFQQLSVLDLCYNELTEVPESLGNLKIIRLDLSNNKLNALSDGIWANSYTLNLFLDNNYISKIPISIENARTLSNLYVNNNSLVDVPQEVFTLNLRSLFLDGNYLTNVPKEIEKVQTLQILHLHNNNIKNVINSIGRLVRLRILDLRNNSIKELSEEAVVDLKALEYIYLSDNPVCSNGWLDKVPKVKNIVEKSTDLGAGCKPQCSIYCQDRWVGDGFCVRDCNSFDCNYDGGDCTWR